MLSLAIVAELTPADARDVKVPNDAPSASSAAAARMRREGWGMEDFSLVGTAGTRVAIALPQGKTMPRGASGWARSRLPVDPLVRFGCAGRASVSRGRALLCLIVR